MSGCDEIVVSDHMEGGASLMVQSLQMNAFVHPVATEPLVVWSEPLLGDDHIRFEVILIGNGVGRA
jgi:hypothetical protein